MRCIPQDDSGTFGHAHALRVCKAMLHAENNCEWPGEKCMGGVHIVVIVLALKGGGHYIN